MNVFIVYLAAMCMMSDIQLGICQSDLENVPGIKMVQRILRLGDSPKTLQNGIQEGVDESDLENAPGIEIGKSQSGIPAPPVPAPRENPKIIHKKLIIRYGRKNSSETVPPPEPHEDSENIEKEIYIRYGEKKGDRGKETFSGSTELLESTTPPSSDGTSTLPKTTTPDNSEYIEKTYLIRYGIRKKPQPPSTSAKPPPPRDGIPSELNEFLEKALRIYYGTRKRDNIPKIPDPMSLEFAEFLEKALLIHYGIRKKPEPSSHTDEESMKLITEISKLLGSKKPPTRDGTPTLPEPMSRELAEFVEKAIRIYYGNRTQRKPPSHTGDESNEKNAEIIKSLEKSMEKSLHGGDIPSLSNGGKIPSLDNGGKIPSLDNGGKIPSLDNGGKIPSLDNGGKIPSLDNGGKIPSLDNGGKIPSLDNGGKIPSLDNGGKIPSFPNGGKIPTLPEGGKNPTRPNGGEVPTQTKPIDGGASIEMPAGISKLLDSYGLHSGDASISGSLKSCSSCGVEESKIKSDWICRFLNCKSLEQEVGCIDFANYGYLDDEIICADDMSLIEGSEEKTEYENAEKVILYEEKNNKSDVRHEVEEYECMVCEEEYGSDKKEYEYGKEEYESGKEESGKEEYVSGNSGKEEYVFENNEYECRYDEFEFDIERETKSCR